MDISHARERFPGMGERFFNPKHAVAWVEQQPSISQVVNANDIFQELLQSAARPKQSSGSACAKLCGFVEQCSKSESLALREFAFAEETARDLFNFFIEWNEQDQHRSMRLVLDFLKVTILKCPNLQVGQLIKTRILHEIVSMITLKSTRPSIKSSMTALDYFLQRDLVFLSEVLDVYREVHQIPREQDVSWDAFVGRIFGWMELTYVRPLAGKLLVTIFTLPWFRNQSTRFLPDSWHKLLRSGLSRDVELLETIKLYTLMPLFKLDKEQSLNYLGELFALQDLTKDSNSSLTLDSLIWLAALEAAKNVGLIGEPSHGAEVHAGGATQLHESVLEDLLCHTSHQARSSAVSILIASPSTSKPYTIGSLDLLKKHMPAFHADADARFRYDVLGHSRNMVMRIVGSNMALRRDCERILKKSKKLDSTKVVSSIEDHTTKPRSANEATVNEIESVIQHQEYFINWYLGFLKHELVSTASYPRHITALKAMDFVLRSALLQDGQDDTKATKSKFSLVDDTWLRAILDLFMDPFDDVREMAASLLMLPSSNGLTTGSVSIEGLSRPILVELEEFCSRSSALASKTSRADHSDGAARSYEVLCHWTTSQEDKLAIPARILADLEARLSAAESDLASAVLETPVHGSFAALRYIWDALSGEKFSQDELQVLDTLQSRAIRCCGRIWQTVRHVLCDDSPEGHLPEELEEVDGLDTKDLLSYSFRAIHESSNLLRALAGNAKSQNQAGLLKPSWHAFEAIGNLTFDELSNLRHRGAFTTVSQTFTSCCQLVNHFSASSTQGVNLLDRWYEGTLSCIYVQASTTRRSAGIPALIVGILSSNSVQPSFDAVMHKLQDIAQQPARVSETDGSNLPQVHALNCVKDVFKSSNLSRRAEPYLTECLQLAAESLKSEIWGIRNCGLLLLRSLIDCIFGTTESKTSMEAGWDGRSTKIAWHKYKALPSLLVNLLEMGQTAARPSEGATTAESVFPALDIIRRAGPPAEFEDKLYSIVAWYLGSRIWHVREIAARTLCSFLLKSEWLDSIGGLLRESHSSANKLHGALLTFKFLLERLFEVMPDQLLKHYPAALLGIMTEVSTADGSFHTCSEARAVFFEIISFINGLPSGESTTPSPAPGGNLIQPELYSTPSPGKDQRNSSSALVRSKQVQAAVDYDLRQLATQGKSEALKLQYGLSGDVNTVCDVLESISTNSAKGISLSNPNMSAQILKGCMATCFETQDPGPRTLALEMFATHLDTLLLIKLPQRPKDLLPLKDELVALWAHLQTNPMNLGLADAIIRASGPLLAAVVTQSDDIFDPSMDQWLRSWGEMMSDAGNSDNGFDTRISAVLAISSFSHHMNLAAKTPPTCHLPWLLALYDALNDDDYEVRDIAAAATTPILGKPLVSMEACSRLLVWLSQHFGHADEFRTHVACRMVGHPAVTSRLTDAVLSAWVAAADQLAGAMQFDDALFVVEEQNLYVDEVREARRWRGVFASLPHPADGAALRALASWTAAGLQTLAGLAEADDGVLGWTSKPEVFAICSRIVVGGTALAGRDPGVKDALLDFLGKGRRTRAHGLLLSMCEVV